MSSPCRRALVAVAAILAVGAPVAAAPPADAHTCASVSVWVTGGEHRVGSCNAPEGDPGDLCAASGITPAGTGVSFGVCVALP